MRKPATSNLLLSGRGKICTTETSSKISLTRQFNPNQYFFIINHTKADLQLICFYIGFKYFSSTKYF